MILFDYIKQIPPFITYEVYDHFFGAYFNNSAIFQGWGIHLYTGKFGTGKTSTLAQIAYNYCVRYPQLSILTNINLQNFPEWTNIYKLNSAQDILHAPKNCIVVIDEIGTIFNSRDFSGGKRAVPKPLFQHLCQCRKRKMMILATVQRFNLLDKQIRDITATVSTCRATFCHPYTRLIKVKTYDIDEYEDENGNITLDMLDTRKFKDKQSQSGEVRSDSVQRAKQSIFDIVYQNDWKYFLTITFSGKDFDRSDPREVFKPLKRWFDNAVQRKGLRYVLVPEFHKKGGIHCHALINDCDFKFVDSGTRLVKGHDKPLKIDTIKRLHICDKLGCDISDLPVVYNVSDWRYGFSTAIQTYGQMSNLAFYVTKYITKDVKKIFGKFFWSSKNIVRKTKEIYCNSDFKDDLPIVSPPRANVCYQYESSFTFSSQVEKNCNDILQYLKENGNDDVL